MAAISLMGAHMKAVIIEQYGDDSVLKLCELAPPADAEVLVQVAWAGLNYVDIYQREGRYPGTSLPHPLGIEAAGTVIQAQAASGFRPGDRVAVTTGVRGAYAEQLAVPAAHLLHVPAQLSLQQACAVIEHGLTADILLHDVARLQHAQTVLVHAAAGGVGGLLIQLLKRRGLRVLATVSSAEKAQWVNGTGAEAIIYGQNSGPEQDWLTQVMQKTEGRGVDVVFDSVGLTTFTQSLAALAVCGHLVLFGAASGVVEPVSPGELAKKSATLSRPVMPHYLRDPAILRERAARLFREMIEGQLQVRIDTVFPLEQAVQAQRRLASRLSQGKILLRVAGE
jgi:NADPH2:quinone reductase